MDFMPMNFVTNLIYLAAGLAGIFLVMGTVIILTIILNRVFSKKNKDDNSKN